MVNVSLPLNTHTSESNYLRKWGRTGLDVRVVGSPLFYGFLLRTNVRVIHKMWHYTHKVHGRQKTITTKTFLLIKRFTTVCVIPFSQLFLFWQVILFFGPKSIYFEFWRPKIIEKFRLLIIVIFLETKVANMKVFLGIKIWIFCA